VRFHFKRLLLIFMMLVLPMQTFASAAMLGCAFSLPGPSSASQMAQGTGDEVLHACHESPQPTTPDTKYNCTHCTACYLATALLMPSTVFTPVVAVSQAAITHPIDSFVGFIADSPERPPRTHFA
jgi:hypothetical protein